MRRVMDGQTVQVRVKLDGGTDRLGNEEPAWAEPVDVPRVLVSASTDDDREYARPFGIRSVVTMAFPRTCELDLRGAKVTVGGATYRVAGEPVHVPSPIDWDMIVRAGVYDG